LAEIVVHAGRNKEKKMYKKNWTATLGGAAAILSALNAAVAAPPVAIGERPACPPHMDQNKINSNQLSFKDIFVQGNMLFNARFNALDGQGRPGSTGAGAPRPLGQPAFIRTSAPDSNACSGCHNLPRSGGGGDIVANVFVLAQVLDPVTFSVSPQFSNERNTLGMFGAGPIEMLAREMSQELIAIREQARSQSAQSGLPVQRELWAKGVYFGKITVLPNGQIDPTEIEGVDWDLVIKPFHQKGAVVSLREFSNNAMNHHHGIQSVERFGNGVDADQDGMRNELSIGDITALSIYQAALATPGRVRPKDAVRRAAAARGEQLFAQINCTSCHIPSMVLNTRNFTEPSPFNPPGNLRPVDVPRVFSFDMTKDGEKPRLKRLPGSRALVEAFTDLKRHNLNDAELNFFANEQVPQGSLRGNAPASDFTIPAPPRPTNEFLTRKLWDVGNSEPYGHRGDLTTITEAIYYHGGEARASRDAYFSLPQADQNAIVEFLKTLQVLPKDSPHEIEEKEPDFNP
jgi:cytochrome c peroxidase